MLTKLCLKDRSCLASSGFVLEVGLQASKRASMPAAKKHYKLIQNYKLCKTIREGCAGILRRSLRWNSSHAQTAPQMATELAALLAAYLVRLPLRLT